MLSAEEVSTATSSDVHYSPTTVDALPGGASISSGTVPIVAESPHRSSYSRKTDSSPASASSSRKGGPLEAARARVRHLSDNDLDNSASNNTMNDHSSNNSGVAATNIWRPQRLDTAALRQELNDLEMRHSQHSSRSLDDSEEEEEEVKKRRHHHRGHKSNRDDVGKTPSRRRAHSRQRSSRSKGGEEILDASIKSNDGDNNKQDWREWRAKKRQEEGTTSRPKSRSPSRNSSRPKSRRHRSSDNLDSSKSTESTTSGDGGGGGSHHNRRRHHHRSRSKRLSSRRLDDDKGDAEEGPWTDWSSKRNLEGKKSPSRHRRKSRSRSASSDAQSRGSKRSLKSSSQKEHRSTRSLKKASSKRLAEKQDENPVQSQTGEDSAEQRDQEREIVGKTPPAEKLVTQTSSGADSREATPEEAVVQQEEVYPNNVDPKELLSSSGETEILSNQAATLNIAHERAIEADLKGSTSSKEPSPRGGVTTPRSKQQMFDVPSLEMDESHALRKSQTTGKESSIPSSEKDESHALRKKTTTRAKSQRSLSTSQRSSQRSLASGDSSRYRKNRQVFDEITPWKQWGSKSTRALKAGDEMRDDTPGRKRRRFLDEIARWKLQFGGSKKKTDPNQRSFRRRKTFEAIDLSRSSDVTTKTGNKPSATFQDDALDVPENHKNRSLHTSEAEDLYEPAEAKQSAVVETNEMLVVAAMQHDLDPIEMERRMHEDTLQRKSSVATAATVKHHNISDQDSLLPPPSVEISVMDPNEIMVEHSAGGGSMTTRRPRGRAMTDELQDRSSVMDQSDSMRDRSETTVETLEETRERLKGTSDERKAHKKSKKKRKKKKDSKSKRRSKSVDSPREKRPNPRRTSSARNLEASMSLSDVFRQNSKSELRSSSARKPSRSRRRNHESGDAPEKTAASARLKRSSSRRNAEGGHTIMDDQKASRRDDAAVQEPADLKEPAVSVTSNNVSGSFGNSEGSTIQKSHDSMESSTTISTAGASNDTIETNNTSKASVNDYSNGDTIAASNVSGDTSAGANNDYEAPVDEASKKKSKKSKKSNKFAIPPPPLAHPESSDDDGQAYPTPYM